MQTLHEAPVAVVGEAGDQRALPLTVVFLPKLAPFDG